MVDAALHSTESNLSLELKKEKKELLRVPLHLCGYFALSFLVEFTALLTLVMHYENGWNIALIAGVCIGGVALLVYFIFLFAKLREKLELLFVILVIPLGLLFVLFMLPTQVPDELTHIYRLFDFFSNGIDVFVPLAVYDGHVSGYSNYWELLSQDTNYSAGVTIDSVASSYSSLLYLVPSIGTFIGQALGLNIYLSIIIARSLNLLLFVVCGYLLIKKLPVGKTILFVYLLNPLLLQQQASCSADVLVNIVSLAFIVAFVYIYVKKEALTKIDIAILVGLLILLMVCKYIYLVLALVLLAFLPRIKSKKKRVGIIVAMGLLFSIAVFVVLSIGSNVGTISAMVLLILDPVELIKVYWKTFEVQTLFYLQSFSGGILGSLNIVAPHVWILYLGMLLTTVFVTCVREEYSLSRVPRFLFIVTGIILAIILPLTFRAWGMEIDHIYDYLQGAQGRYYIPVVILFLLAAFKGKQAIFDKKADIIYSVLIIGVVVFDILYVVRFFY